MQITVLCNAGLALSYEGNTLLIDAPNETIAPFCQLDDDEWNRIINHEPPYNQICGFWFTHEHPDHYSKEKISAYLNRWPETPVFVPQKEVRGKFCIGPFVIEYQRFDHAPMDVPVPPHVVTLISAGNRTVYIAADAKLDVEAHKSFLKGQQVDIAFWNSMYLSRPETRNLLQSAAKQNYIYHMPETRPDSYGLWRKLEKNLEHYKDELITTEIIAEYPCRII